MTAAEAQAAIDKRNKVVLVVLMVGLLVCVGRVYLNKGGPDTAKAVASSQTVATVTPTTGAKASAEKTRSVIEFEAPVKAYARLFQLAPLPVEETVEPEVQAVAEKEVEPTISTKGLKLGSTIVSGQASIAIINGELYRLGQSVNGMAVTKIEQRSVHLSANGQTAVLRIDSK
jgi:hypothetical protein